MPQQSVPRLRPAEPEAPLRTWRRNGLFGLLTGWLVPWRERRHVARTSRLLVKAYRNQAALQPGQTERALQRAVIMQHLEISEPVAEAVLRQAEENFATWPVRRPLTLPDIIHFVAFHTFVSSGQGDAWIHSDLTPLIRENVPSDLWGPQPRATVHELVMDTCGPSRLP